MNKENGRFREATLEVDPPSPDQMNAKAYIDFPDDSLDFLNGENKSLGLAISMADDFFITANKKSIRLLFGIFNTYQQEGINA